MRTTFKLHPAFAQAFSRGPWLIQEETLIGMLASAERASFADIEQARASYAASSVPTYQREGDIAVIKARGPITYRRSWLSYYYGGVSIEEMQEQLLLAMQDPDIKTVAFAWDSPGGSVEMIPEFAEEISRLSGAMNSKPIVSIADTMICSAAYWLASQTQRIFAPASACIGSIGAFLLHIDISQMLEEHGVKVTVIRHGAHKIEANEFEPLSDEARAELQALIDEVGDEFDTAVARGRGVTKKVVLDKFGQGRYYRGKEAIALGLADQRATIREALAKLSKRRGSSGAAAAEAPPAIAAKADSVEPEDGRCPDGYELGDDGRCYLAPEKDQDEAEAAATVGASTTRRALLSLTALTED